MKRLLWSIAGLTIFVLLLLPRLGSTPDFVIPIWVVVFWVSLGFILLILTISAVTNFLYGFYGREQKPDGTWTYSSSMSGVLNSDIDYEQNTSLVNATEQLRHER